MMTKTHPRCGEVVIVDVSNHFLVSVVQEGGFSDGTPQNRTFVTMIQETDNRHYFILNSTNMQQFVAKLAFGSLFYGVL